MENLIQKVREGKFTIVYEEDRSFLSIPAEIVDSDSINFIMKNCDEIRLSLPWHRISSLGLNKFFFSGNVIPIDPKKEKISAEDRANFIKKLVFGDLTQEEIKFPGRIFVEETKEIGILERPGIAEACSDLARLAGFKACAVYAPILTPEGEVAGKDYAENFSKLHSIPLISIKELIEFRLKNEKIVERVVEATLPTKFYGTFRAIGYKSPIGEIIALVRGNVAGDDVLVRIHSECLTGDVLHSLRCDCGEQLESALKMIDRENRGVLIYMRGQEGRGIGLINKLLAYKLQENGIDTVDANIKLGFPPDLRSYGVSAQILMDLGVKSVRLLTNNPLKIEELAKYGFNVKREAIEVEPTEVNLNYLKAKRDKMGHFLCIND
ncbi:MAG: 3,4-dihydroxy 2-butanone 4-phosphate synthase / cyclohydrolase [Archaeoglobaceae archaeon]|nr:3,4-dihydroxy 2-butanone 4-phosphate synthase / cyclohydrolase [Archaeoglobaceae archaeon]